MSEKKWTPGRYLRVGCFLHARDNSGSRPKNRWTARVENYGGTAPREECEAVATLFQAAPLLYEALERLTRELGAVWCVHQPELEDRSALGVTTYDSIKALLDSAKEALAAARGDQS